MYAEVKNNANKLFSSFLRPPKLPPPPLVSPVLYDTTPLTEKVYPKKENITTYLTTAPPFDKRFNYSPQPTSEAKPLETVTAASSETPVDQRIKQAPDLTMTLVPVLSVFAIFLAVGFIALMFRKKIYLGRSKDVKEDMVSIILFVIIVYFLFLVIV